VDPPAHGDPRAPLHRGVRASAPATWRSRPPRWPIEQAGPRAEGRRRDPLRHAEPGRQLPRLRLPPGHKLGLPGVPALDVRNQCSGFLYSLSVADAWVRAGVYRTCSWSAPRSTRRASSSPSAGRDVAVLFGDGAGAVLVGEATRPEQGILRDRAARRRRRRPYDLWLEAPASKYMPRLTHEMLDAGALPAHERQAGLPLGYREDARGGPLGAEEAGFTIEESTLRPPPGQHAHQPDGRGQARDPRAEGRPQHRACTATPPPRRSRSG
jgi:hypothetical protein